MMAETLMKRIAYGRTHLKIHISYPERRKIGVAEQLPETVIFHCAGTAAVCHFVKIIFSHCKSLPLDSQRYLFFK